MPRPTFSPMTLPAELYDAVSARIGQEFADSYLTGAVLDGRKLIPRTQTGYGRMRDTSAFMALLREVGIDLVKPEPLHKQAAPISHQEIWKA